MVRGQLTFITGGVRCGKSAYAERLLVAKSENNGGRLVYIASGMNTDSEMNERIQKHKQDRADFNWVTYEKPIYVEEVLPSIQKDDLVLWDCLTTWLANALYDGIKGGTPCIERSGCIAQKIVHLATTIDALLEKAAHIVVVSNEVFDELPSPFVEVEVYRKWLGQLHQSFVLKADTAIEMEYGLAKVWKGARIT